MTGNTEGIRRRDALALEETVTDLETALQAAEDELALRRPFASIGWAYVRYAMGGLAEVRIAGLAGPALISSTEIEFSLEGDEVGVVIVGAADNPVIYQWRPKTSTMFSVIGHKLDGSPVDFTTPGPWAFALDVKRL